MLSSRSLAILIFTLFVAATLAGCLDPQRSASYQAYGAKGSYTTGFAYNGRGIVPFDGPVYLDVSDETNTGRLIAKGKIGPTPFVVTFDEFAQSKPFHDGGIAANLIEHGDSGVGDTTIPKVDLEMVGWGQAKMQYDGKPYNDPVTGAEFWTAHFMVIRNGVRDNATGAIYADANKSVPYDPKEPGKGFSAPVDYEIHLVLRNGTAAGNASKGSLGGFSRSSPTPDTAVNEERVLFKAEKLGSEAQVNFTVEDTVTRGSNLTFTLTAPSGAIVIEHTAGDATTMPGTMTRTTGFGVRINEVGDYTLAITGRLNPGGGYEVQYALAPPAAVVLNLWWEDILFGLDAQERAAADGLMEESSGDPSPSMSGSITGPTFAPSGFSS